MGIEKIEQYVDELYSIHKESSRRMSDLTRSNKAIVTHLEKEVLEHVKEIKSYCKLFSISITAITIIFGAAVLWSFYSFKVDFDTKLYLTYDAFNKVRNVQVEQNRVLEELKDLKKEKEVEKVTKK